MEIKSKWALEKYKERDGKDCRLLEKWKYDELSQNEAIAQHKLFLQKDRVADCSTAKHLHLLNTIIKQ